MSIDMARPGICSTCPHFQKINTPYSLGIKDGDLPPNYQRENNQIEVRVFDKEAKAFIWKTVVQGDIHTPILIDLGKKRQLNFKYERAGRAYSAQIDTDDIVADAKEISTKLNNQGFSVDRTGGAMIGVLMNAWINKLRDLRQEQKERQFPFGWSQDETGAINGFAHAGILYRPDGSSIAVAGGDEGLIQQYKPQGAFLEWRAAADYVLTGRPALQAIVAAAFGSPLMRFTGQKGVVLSAWSRDSGWGKSSAMEVARSVWGDSATKSRLNDTNNAMFKRLGETRVLPCIWDELRVDDKRIDDVVAMLFQVTEGKEKARMRADTTMRAAAEWEAITVAASNQSLMDIVAQRTAGGTDAASLRLLEFEIRGARPPADPRAPMMVALTNNHYGRAGEALAIWLAQNHKLAEALVHKQAAQVTADIKASTEERFYVAGVAAMLSGAAIARKMGLFDFDMAGLKSHLYQAVYELRAYRGQNMMVSNGQMDIEQIFGTFYNLHQHERLVTDRLPGQGVKVRVIFMLATTRTITVHVSVREQFVRFDRAKFYDWCRTQRINPRSTFDEMVSRWGAKMVRCVLAAGTDLSTKAQLHAIELDLNHPALTAFQYVDPNAPTPKAAPTAAPAKTP
jgi:hypothetical protein